MKHFIALLLLTAFLCDQLCGQATTLGPGDIAFTLINTDGANTDAFAFVLLTDVAPTTKIVITDEEVLANGLLETEFPEGRLEITFTNSFSCGTQIFVTDINPATAVYNFQASTGPGNTTGLTSTKIGTTDLSLSTSGETLIAFQDANPNTSNPANYLSALANTGVDFGVMIGSGGSSALPPGLTRGVNALALPPKVNGEEIDNHKYSCNIITGTPAQLSSGIYTASNWNGDDANNFPVSGCNFTCLSACTDPVLNDVTANPASSCPGTAVTLTINGSLGDATAWRLHEGNCSGPIIATTTGSSFTVNPAGTTTFFVSVLDCNSVPVCASTVLTRSVQSADAGTDQLLVAGTATNLSANPSGAGSGTWTVISGDGNGAFGNASSPTSSFTGTAGKSYKLRWTISGGGCTTTSDDVEISFTQGGTNNLTAGDLAFVGYNSDAPDEFSFLLLREIEAGTGIFFTDMGWLQSGGFRASAEGLIRLTFNRHYGCGDVFYLTRTVPSGNNWEAFEESGATAGTVSVPAVPGRFPDIATIGDQLFAFQGSLNSPTLLAGIHVASAWSNAIDNKSSAQPPALTGNNTSVNLAQDFDNGIYDCGVTSGSPVTLRTAINNAANWNTSDNLITLTPTCNFDCQDCTEPVITNLSINPSPVCAGQETVITVTGDLNGANRWIVYAPGDCGGTELAASNGGNTITFTPSGTGTYLVAGVDGCVATPNCSSLPITQTGLPAEITMQQPTTKVSGTSVALTATAPGGGQTGTWSIVSGSNNNGSITDPSGPGTTLTGTAGGGYLLQYSVTGNGCPETTDEVSVSFLVDNGVSFGGMVFTGYNSSAPDNFSVVVLESLTAGTSFSVTDNGWLAAGGFRAGEQTANYLLCRPLNCGDNIRFEADGKGYASNGAVVAELQGGSSFPNISSVGDQLFLYAGFTAPTAGDQSAFLAAIQMNCENGTCSGGNWDGEATDNSSSAKPAFFATSGTVFGGTSPPNNARYDCANGTSNALDLFALISSDANWSFQNNAFTLNGCGFTCDPPPTAICQDITVEIDADGNPTTNGQPFTASDLDGGSTDNGAIDPDGFSVDITPGCANVTNPSSATTITLTVTDDLSGTSTCTSQLTVEDNVAPTFDCTDISVELNASGEYFLTSNDVLGRMVQNWSDNCAPTPANFGSGSRTITCANITNGTFTYAFGALDGNGQEATCSSVVTVMDPTLICDDAPVAMCTATAVVQVDANGDLDLTTINNGSTDDNTPAGDLILSIDGDVLDCDDADKPAQTVTLIVTDNAGQTSTCISTVTVADNIAPIITCQNITVDLSANGTIVLNTTAIANAVLTSFNDNCAAAPVSLGFTLGTVGCTRIGVNNITIFYRDRPLSGTSREASCTVQIQINDPLGACGSDPVVNCQDFAAGGDANGDYTLNANSLDNGSTDDRSIYSLVFSDATDRQESLTQDCEFTNAGQGQTFTAGITGVIQHVRVRATASTSTNIHLYPGNVGSGIAGSVGTPAYSQPVELFTGINGTFTTITLTTPFPVVAGQEYSFLFEGTNSIRYACFGSPSYGGGRAIENYLGFTSDDTQDYSFQVDIIGTNTQDFSGDGDYPTTVYAVDDQGNVSAACNATFTLDQSLPVDWLSFGANAGAKQVDLRWETSWETDNAGFHVERAANTRDWTVIAEVTASNVADQVYDLADRQPLSGVSYYRIRQTDFDGTVTHSPIARVEFVGEASILISPNPTSGQLTVRLPTNASIIGLSELTGRTVSATFLRQDNGLTTNLKQLPAGLYLLRIRMADGSVTARRVVKR